jgi:hypothetical protein
MNIFHLYKFFIISSTVYCASGHSTLAGRSGSPPLYGMNLFRCMFPSISWTCECLDVQTLSNNPSLVRTDFRQQFAQVYFGYYHLAIFTPSF